MPTPRSSASGDPPAVPVIDIAPLIHLTSGRRQVADAIGRACREFGFFYIVNHGVSESLQQRLEDLARTFFERPLEEKMRIRMALGGKAWRGYFPVKGELTSGKPDLKEGLYFGSELDGRHPKVRHGVPLHGRNLFPDDLPELRETVLTYMDALTSVGHHLMRGLSMSLGLAESYFAERYTGDPLILFRIFHYPPPGEAEDAEGLWGVGEHTDYGVLTILKQDEVGGLQIKTKDGWIDAPVVPGTFVCNIGDMLDRLTRGLYRSTPHRVRNPSRRGRYSFPFFFDPGFDARIEPIDLSNVELPAERGDRWDGADVHAFQGTYGEYVLGKVGKVFPELMRDVARDE